MLIYYSGSGIGSNGEGSPEHVLRDANEGKGTCLMLSYYDLGPKKPRATTVRRFRRLVRQRLGKLPRKKERNYLPDKVHSHFLDSGAHGLYAREVLRKKQEGSDKFKWYKTSAFREYIDLYVEFVRQHRAGIDDFANVDVIFNPELTWEAQQYIEKEHKLRPVPVIHWGTPLKWVKHYLSLGYEYIALGGLGQEVKVDMYYNWADQVYKLLCPYPQREPVVKTHGFAMTTHSLMWRYPWWSVDSASWVKVSAYGHIYVPHKRKGEFAFDISPYIIAVSAVSTDLNKREQHIKTLSGKARAVVMDWLDYLGIEFGETERDKKGNVILNEKNKPNIITPGVENDYTIRNEVNLRLFDMVQTAIPAWPRPFGIDSRKGFGLQHVSS